MLRKSSCQLVSNDDSFLATAGSASAGTHIAATSTECTHQSNEEPDYKPYKQTRLLRALSHPFRQLCYRLLHTDLLNTRESLEFISSEKENRHDSH